MTKQDFINVCLETIEELRQSIFIPWDTGNMATNALKYEIIGNELHIYIDEEIAPYVPYTNEPWISPQWRGRKNPNEGWWGEWCEIFINRVATKLKGELL